MPEGGQLAIQATIKRATLTAHRAVEGLDGEALADLERIYRQAAADISRRIAQHAGPDGNLALAEMRSALAQVQGELARLADLRDSLLQTSLQRAVNLGVQPYTQAAVQTVDGGMRIATDALEFVRNFVAEDGLQLSDRIWRIDRGARDKVINVIEQAVIQGHSAQQAARDLLLRGNPVPIDVRNKINAANAKTIGGSVTSQLLTGPGSPMDNAMRLMRTEINRAHGEAYMKGGEGTPGFAGWRYLLSPAHPEPDICDLLSSQNLHGLGAGVYPDRARTPWPAHPNTLSFIVMVFESEITDADRKGKETPLQALARLTPAQRLGALGKGKREIFDQGKLTQGMIRTPLRSVLKRIGSKTVPLPRQVKRPDPPVVPPPRRAPPKRRIEPKPKNLDEMVAFGGRKLNELLEQAGKSTLPVPESLPSLINADLARVREIGVSARVASSGRAAAILDEATKAFPADWIRKTDRLGPLTATYKEGRAYYFGYPDGTGKIMLRNYSSAVHEFTHRMQQAMPQLDDFFQDLHHRRTAGNPRKKLRHLIPGVKYASHEVAQEDQYVSPYQGRIYSGSGFTYLGKHGALEVMTMAIEDLLGRNPVRLQRMLEGDREMANLVIGLLYNYVP